MNADRTPAPLPDGGFPDLGPMKARTLLQMALVRGRSPLDDLLLRLGSAGGEDRFSALLRIAAARLAASPDEELREGKASPDRLAALKGSAKELFRTAEDADGRLAATLAYFLVIAAALAHHRKSLTGQTRGELARAWGDLSALSPPPWCDLFSKAIEALPPA